MECKDEHKRIVFDQFAKDIGGRRVPGDCYCLDCKSPIPAWWNKGKPVPVEAAKQ